MKLTTAKPMASKACLICSFIGSDITSATQRLRRFISRDHIQYVARNDYHIPDSYNCKKALELVSACSPDHLINHSLRSYAFGIAMAHKIKKPFDKEVFFLGAIMHDLGLTEEYDKGNTFEIDGAVAARSFCIDHGLTVEKADLVHEMIAHHNSVGKAHKMDPEIALLHFGAGADVAGLWINDIHKKTLSEIISEYPRLDFKQAFAKLLSEQVERKPESYMKPLLDLGFLKKIQEAPF